MAEKVGEIYYEVGADIAPLLGESEKAKVALNSLGEAAKETTPDFNKLSKGAKAVSSALAMPEVNKLSARLAQLSGKIGASSDAVLNASDAQNKFHGALGTVASRLGAGYISNVGSATAALIKHAKEAVAATNAQLDNAASAQKEVVALKESASQLVVKAAAEKKLAESAVQVAATEMQVAEAVFARKEAEVNSLAALLSRQKETLRQSEANLLISNSEKAVAQAMRTRNAVEATQEKMLRQSNQAVKEVTAAEDRVRLAKVASAAANEKLTQALALEAAAVSTVTKASAAATIAAEKLTAASKVQAAAVAGARSALSLLGGPSGILLLAAAGVYSLYQAMNDTSGIENYKQEIEDAARRTEYLTKVQAEAVAGKARIKLVVDTAALKDAQTELAELKNRLYTALQFKADPGAIQSLSDQISVMAGKVNGLGETVRIGQERIAQFTRQAAKAGEATTANAAANEVYDKSMKSVIDSNDLLEKALHESLAAAREMAAEKSLRNALSETGASADEMEKQVAKLKSALAKKTELTFEQELRSIEQNIAALRLEMVRGKEAAIEYRAAIAAANNGLDPEQTRMYVDAKKEEFALTKKLSEQKKKDASDKSSAKRGANEAEKVAQKLANMKRQAELAANSTQELTREQQLLRAEQSLGAGATEKQKLEARDYTAAAIDAAAAAKGVTEALKNIPAEAENKSYAESAKNLKAALDARKITQQEYDAVSEKAEQQHQINLAKIRAESNSGVTAIQDAAGSVDPVQALANENARKLALIQEFENQKVITQQQSLALVNAANTEYEQARIDAAWKIWENQSQANQMLGSAIDSLQGGATNAITGLLNGTQSLSESFANIGSTILNSVVSGLVEMGLQYVKNMIMGQAAAAAALASTTAQATAATAAWAPAAMSASIATLGSATSVGTTAYTTALAASKGLAIAGARKNGGPVSVGSIYQVGEGGMPEIYQASTGKQYMIPGDNGKVISNSDLQNSGTSGSTIQQNNYFTIQSSTGDPQEIANQMAKIAYEQSLRAMKNEQRPGGMLRN
ncbi:hypothetical protein [Erwinia phyllosphaerae]|uniref:hypothetical protein n=1 Tax=Erwinia phyllosphaerae TaxID=2853256 RepID=UPI001FEE0547|nr:hypothetical protein [Erwinia phyllosphaerae]MBV4366296.1 hypothetical protein [Erwinia phyllosphaerae]